MVKITSKIYAAQNEDLMKYCKDNLVIDNPEYENKKKLGLWLGNTPRKLNLYETDQEKVIIPFGELQNIWHLIKDEDLETNFCTLPVEIKGECKLYDYQQEALDEILKKKNGVLVSPAGSGKTQIGIAAIKAIGLKTLWVTHTLDLVNQSKKRFEQYFKCRIGTITGGKVDIGDVTFCTVQTLVKMDDIKDFGVVIIDECHRLASSPSKMTMFGKVINRINARYKIGLTATAHRADGMIRSMYAYLGNIIHEVPKSAVADKTLKADIKVVDTGFVLERFGQSFEADGTINFVKMMNEICNDEKRNDDIVRVIKKYKNKSCIVLSSRLSQLKYLHSKLGYGIMIDGSMVSKKNKEKREKYIEDMRTGKETLLFASYNLAKEGLDIPCLEVEFLASPVKDYAVVVQSVGRIERTFKGKKKSLVVDFVDNLISITMNMFKKRKSIYKKNNNKIIKE